MASGAAPVRFRPMPVPELFDELFRLYRRYFPVIAGISLLLVLPGLVTNLLSGAYRANPLAALSQYFNGGGVAVLQQFQQAGTQQNPVWELIGALIGLFLVPFTIGALYRAAVDAAKGVPITVGSVLRGVLERYWALWGLGLVLFGLALVWVIGMVIGGVLFIIPGIAVFCLGILFGVRWSLAVPAMMSEGVGPIRGLSRSWNLTAATWWRTFGILLLTLIAYFVISAALGSLFTVIAAVAPGQDVRSAVATTGTTLANALIAPIFPIMLTLLYFDLRTRKEGLDLDQLARETSPGPAPV